MECLPTKNVAQSSSGEELNRTEYSYSSYLHWVWVWRKWANRLTDLPRHHTDGGATGWKWKRKKNALPPCLWKLLAKQGGLELSAQQSSCDGRTVRSLCVFDMSKTGVRNLLGGSSRCQCREPGDDQLFRRPKWMKNLSRFERRSNHTSRVHHYRTRSFTAPILSWLNEIFINHHGIDSISEPWNSEKWNMKMWSCLYVLSSTWLAGIEADMQINRDVASPRKVCRGQNNGHQHRCAVMFNENRSTLPAPSLTRLSSSYFTL